MTAVWNHLGYGGQLGVACVVTWAVAITGLCAWSWHRHQRAEARRAGADALIIAIATQARVDFETEHADLAAWENELADGGQR